MLEIIFVDAERTLLFYPSDLSLKKYSFNGSSNRKEKEQFKMADKTDLSILAQLQTDGRLSNSKLASAVAISEAACWRRVRALEKSGHIQNYQANLNRRKLGFGVTASVQVTYIEHDTQTTEEFERIMLYSDNVLTCHNTTGQADYLLQVVAKDLDDYSRFIDQVLRRLKGVSAIQSNISLKELKSSSRLPLG